MAFSLDSLIGNVKNKFYNSSTGKLLSGQNWMATTQGGEFIPEYTKTDGQKKFNTTSSIPNLPKPKTMFFVYFNINEHAQNLIQKRRQLIEYLSLRQQNEATNTVISYEEKLKQKENKNIIDSVTDSIDSSLHSLTKQYENAKNVLSENKNENTESTKITTADYIPDKMILKQLSFELSKYVKSVDKPKITYSTKEYNEYNRRRLCYESRKYQPITISFYDVKENPVQQFFFAYLKLIDDTYLCKGSNNYKRKIYTQEFDSENPYWGFNLDSNFRLIDSISIIEMYMDKMMVYTLENPVVEDINFGSNTVGDYTANEITVSFNYEGLTNDLLVGEYSKPIEPYTNNLDESNSNVYLKSMINAEIREDIATFLQKRYKDGTAFAIDNATSFIKGILDAPKDERWDKVQSQLLDTGRKLGFADEINMVNKATEAVDNYKDSENKSKYLLKLSDDPSSILGSITSSGITTSDNSILGLF